MGLGDWFKKKAPPAAPPAARQFHEDRGRMFDLDRTHRLAALFGVPQEGRNAAWHESFWDAAWSASVALAEPRVLVGPDGFPYLRLDLPAEGAFDSQCLGNVAQDCLRNMVGAAFFASPQDPPEAAAYVLSLGLIDSLVRYDSPYGDPIDLEEAALPPSDMVRVDETGGQTVIEVTGEHHVLVGTPSAEYLPPHLAASLHHHLTNGWGMENPGIQLVSDVHLRPHRSLLIGRKRSEFPEGAPIDAMAQMLLWHLNPGRKIMLMPEDWTLGQLTPLTDLFERP